MTATEWDLKSLFPDFDSEERRAFEDSLAKDATALFVTVRGLGPIGRALEEETHWEAAILEYEKLTARLSHLSTFITCLASADALDERFTQAEGRLSIVRGTFDKIVVELRRALRDTSSDAMASFVRRPGIQGAEFFIHQLRREAAHAMPSELEGLASDLGTDGIVAWGRLYDALSGKLTFQMKREDGTEEKLSVAERRSLMASPDRKERESAFRCGNIAWESIADACAASLNHIAGTRHTLNARRKVDNFLDVALDQALISQKTLDAMMEAVKDRAEIPRRGLRLKAKAMGLPAISWYDLEAPFPLPSAEKVPWERGVELVRNSFSRVYPKLAGFFDQALEKRWIESAARPGKRPGAYCIGSDLVEETRVFMTYQGSLGDVSTLAHEVGHAFHAHVMKGIRVLGKQYPMTLAETASTFAEGILSRGLLSDASLSPGARALLLGEEVSDGAAFLLDVPTRFLFEKKFYQERKEGEVSARRLSELMTESQREVFGDALAVGEEDPLFWASKLHFYIPDISFYNFPYTFGYLLSRGMSAIARDEGAGFLPRYERFLQLTGSAMAHDVARQSLGQDLETPEFWARSIDTLISPTDELERLLPVVLGPR